MKTPNYIYTYFSSHHQGANVQVHEIRVYKPYINYAKRLDLGDNLFSICGQSNLDRDHHVGMRRAYGLRFEGLPVERPESVKLAGKLSAAACSQDNGFPAIIKALKKLGAVRFALGTVDDVKSYNRKEFMPRKFAGKKSVAYWNAVKAGLDIE